MKLPRSMSLPKLKSIWLAVCSALLCLLQTESAFAQEHAEIGREVAIQKRLLDGDEFDTPIPDLIHYGKRLFEAHFTIQDGAGRPLTKAPAHLFPI